jgi:hypothetical protein
MQQLINSSFQISTNVALRNTGGKKKKTEETLAVTWSCGAKQGTTANTTSLVVEMIRRSGIGDDISKTKTDN